MVASVERLKKVPSAFLAREKVGNVVVQDVCRLGRMDHVPFCRDHEVVFVHTHRHDMEEFPQSTCVARVWLALGTGLAPLCHFRSIVFCEFHQRFLALDGFFKVIPDCSDGLLNLPRWWQRIAEQVHPLVKGSSGGIL